MPSGRYYTRNPTEILARAVKSIISDYDYVLIDCPPNLGLITLNGLRIADGYIIPTIPDVLSTYGIPQIQKRVGDFAADIAEEIIEFGIIVTKFRTQAALHHDTIRRLEDDENLPPVFDTKIPEAARTAESAEHVGRSTSARSMALSLASSEILRPSLSRQLRRTRDWRTSTPINSDIQAAAEALSELSNERDAYSLGSLHES